ncbi:MAG: murein biosynthesis integral membrane protein MurJ [Chloroflexota bacterium]|nr:murein biosynthesis integral membrane protein MurJ [Chloroflexota bacterium]
MVAIGFVASRILGLVREILLARQFGTSGTYDAYVSAFRIPDLLFAIVLAGSFGSAFIPVFAAFFARGDERGAWRLASTVLTLSGVVLVLFGAVTFLFAGPIVRSLIAPGLAPADQATAVGLMRLLLLSPLFLGLGIAAKGILEGQNRFVLPALAPVVYGLAIVLGVLFLAPIYGIYGVAISVVIGAAAHFAVQVPGLVRSGMAFRPSLDLETAGLAEVGRLLGPRIVGQAAFHLNFIAVNWFASRTGEGSVTALNNAWQLLMLPYGVLALSISTVIFPTMARLYEQGNILELRSTFGRALQPLLVLTIPAAVILFFFRTAIVQTIFEHGAFDRASTILVSGPLAMFALGLVGYAVVEVLTRVFYAMHDTRTPVTAGIAIIVLNVLLSAVLVGRFGHIALALSLSATTTIEAVILLIVLRRRIGAALEVSTSWLIRVLAATLAMVGVSWLVAPVVIAATVPDQAPRVIQLLLLAYALAVAAVAYLVVAYVLRLPGLAQGWDRLPARITGLPGMTWVGAGLRPDGKKTWRRS